MSTGKLFIKMESRLIHTDGTGFISEDLAKKCPKGIIKVIKFKFVLLPLAPQLASIYFKETYLNFRWWFLGHTDGFFLLFGLIDYLLGQQKHEQEKKKT